MNMQFQSKYRGIIDKGEAVANREFNRVKFLGTKKGRAYLDDVEDDEFKWFPSPIGTQLHYRKKDVQDYYNNLDLRLKQIHKRI
jgi:hypothetical protein